MINSQMEIYEVYENIATKDKYGNYKDNYIFLDKIEVAINFTSITKRTEDIRFKECDFTGITKFKGLKNGSNYILKNEKNNYEIVSVNEFARLSQYLLKRVITNE